MACMQMLLPFINASWLACKHMIFLICKEFYFVSAQKFFFCKIGFL